MKVEQAYEQFRERLVQLMTARTGDRELAKDLVQETFIKISGYMQKGGTFRNAWAFLSSSALNTMRDHYRKRSVNVICNEEEGAEAYGSKFANDTNDGSCLPRQYLVRECVQMMVDELPEPYRYAVRMADLKQIPQKQLAKETGISLSGMKSRVQRGRKLLRERMEAILAGDPDTPACPCNELESDFEQGNCG